MRSQIPIAQLHHPFIMLLNGYFMHENYHYLEIQLGVGPIINYIITDHEQAFKVMLQISSAINYIHSLHILHGDNVTIKHTLFLALKLIEKNRSLFHRIFGR